mmetsp:Transcript_41399/g.96691  ORF Transcript_41399/g.96691 Transcript_41399/m.96691 type:complete len:247 (+) Transcript_41399:1342-2082(+)
MDQQGEHSLWHGWETCLSDAQSYTDLSEGDAEDVQDQQEQADGEEHRPSGRTDAFDHDEYFRKGAQELCDPRHPREPEQPHEAKNRGVSNAVTGNAEDAEHDGRNPGLQDHQGHKQRVEHEPGILECKRSSSESHPPDNPLECKEGAEDVLNNLKFHLRFRDDGRIVVVRVNPDPQRIHSNDEEREVFEVVALGDPLENARRLVEILHRIGLLRDLLPNTLLQVFHIGRDGHSLRQLSFSRTEAEA